MPSQDLSIQVALVAAVLVTAFLVLVRPQLRRIADHQRLLASLKPGDRIVIDGGLVGSIIAFEGTEIVELELSPTVRVKALRRSVGIVLGD